MCFYHTLARTQSYQRCSLLARAIWSQGGSSIKDNLRNLAVLHGGAIVVACCIAELEGHLASVVTINSHLHNSHVIPSQGKPVWQITFYLSEPLGPVMTIKSLQGADLLTDISFYQFFSQDWLQHRSRYEFKTHCSIVGVWLNLKWFLEHCPEGGVGPITVHQVSITICLSLSNLSSNLPWEWNFIRPKEPARACVYKLDGHIIPETSTWEHNV